MEHIKNLAEFYFEYSTRNELENMLAQDPTDEQLTDLNLTKVEYETVMSMALEYKILDELVG